MRGRLTERFRSGQGEGVDTRHELWSDTLVSGVRITVTRALGDPEDVSDAVQQILACALEASREERIPRGVPVAAYVHGIARHVIADALARRVRDRRNRAVDELASESATALETLVRTEEAALVREALGRLSRGDQVLLRRCFVDGERVVDIAVELGEPAARVRKRKSRALARLRPRLEEVLGDRDG
jgi:RNA polymerase sigma factor (sigma-70 family)